MIRALAVALASVCVVMAAACGGGSDASDEFPRVVSLGEGEVFASILNSSLSVGPNRVIMQVDTADDERILEGTVSLRFFDLNDGDPVLRAETDAAFVPVELGYVDEGSPERPREVTGNDGAYIANVAFDRAGEWGVRVLVTTPEREYDEFPFRFTVRERSDEPMVGDAAPASLQATVATVPDIYEIDSSFPPRPQMHDTTIADAVASGRPAVVAFATPAFCTSRLCAPVMDTVMDPLFESYGDSAAFIHVEPYVLRDLRNGFEQNPVPATLEWKVPSEPWIFVVDGDGKVAAKFEGIIGFAEVEQALQATLRN